MLLTADVRMVAVVASVLLGVGAASEKAQAQLNVTLFPVADNTLYESANGSLSNGAGENMFSGLTLRTSSLRRALVRFDLGSLPPGLAIESAKLRMQVTRINGSAADMTLHRVLSSWGEGTSNASEPGGQGIDATANDATWLHRVWPNTLWTTPGGDFSPVITATTVNEFPGDVIWTSTPQMIADLESWRSSPSTNFGWLIQSFSTDVSSARRMGTRESFDPAIRPVLEIRLVPFCEICLSDFNCDGGVDGDDVIAFLGAWDAGDPIADFNFDEGVDGDDVIEFFARWDAGC